MRDKFDDMLKMKGVRGVVLFTEAGTLLFEHFTGVALPEVNSFGNWEAVAEALKGTREGDLVFESGRLYIRKTDSGILIVVMDLTASIAMVKLNCDILLPALKQATSGTKGIKRFFKK